MIETKEGEERSIQLAARLLKAETLLLGVKSVTWEGRNKVQAAFRKLMRSEDFRQSIEASRPNVEECHLIFTPHDIPGDKCLAWWVFPYSDWEIQHEDTYRVFSKPCFAIATPSGGIAAYWDEKGEYILCGYDGM